MSTRATYEFKPANEWSETVTMYIHCDGYPEGAASYFYKMLALASRKDSKYAWKSEIAGGLAEAFMIANPSQAKFHPGRDTQDDTEFHYIIDPRGKSLEIQERAGFAGGQWKTVKRCSLLEFIEKNLSPDWVDDYSPLIKVGDDILTLNYAKLRAVEELAAAVKFDQSNPNYQGHLKNAEAYQQAVESCN